MHKLSVLRGVHLGARVAEDELDRLANYFVKTELWRKVVNDEVDIVLAPKGGGKSAIYASLISEKAEFLEKRIILVPAENPQGKLAFSEISLDPPTSEDEFIDLWKTYILSLLAHNFHQHALVGGQAQHVIYSLAAAGLSPGVEMSPRKRMQLAFKYIRRYIRPKELENSIALDSSGAITGVSQKVVLGDPDDSRKAALPLDDLLEDAEGAMDLNDFRVWIIFDRLDVAFAQNADLERNALRALFKTYLDIGTGGHLKLKVFLRSDIWKSVTKGGFREGSHIARQTDIQWSPDQLLNLVVRRLLSNPEFIRAYKIDSGALLLDIHAQREFFNALAPRQIDVGNNPQTFEWILGRVRDGNKITAPREVIHLLTEARNQQITMLERGELQPPDRELFSAQAFRSSLLEVSRVRLEQTIYAEYPDQVNNISALTGKKAHHDTHSLAGIWKVSQTQARRIANQLCVIGIFERRGTDDDPNYWIPFLYRPILRTVQGKAFSGKQKSNRSAWITSVVEGQDGLFDYNG